MTAVSASTADDLLAQFRDGPARGIWAAGEWLTPAKTYADENPATGEEIAQIADADAEDVDRAVRAAHEAWLAWRDVPAADRGRLVAEFAQAVAAEAEELAVLDSMDGGNPIGWCRRDVHPFGTGFLRYFAGLALQIKGETIPTTIGELDFTVRQPYGVVARIIAFNHPSLFALKAISTPVVAGNVVILKPSPYTPLSAIRIVEIADTVFPKGVVNVVTGGAEPALAMARHPLVRRLGLTGSYAAGLALTRAAAETDVKVVTIESGGKNPMIVLPDANLEAAVQGAVGGMNFTSSAGQSCGSTSRLFVHEDLYPDMLDAVADRMGSLRVGNPLDEDTDVGPLVSDAQLQKTERYVGIAQQEGANLIVGGSRPNGDGFGRGYFYLPTLFDQVGQDARLAREEVFGPVLAAFKWSDVDEVIGSANDVEYGLTASVWTNDLERALTLAKRIDAGYIWINGVSHHQLGSPFGGFKNSGNAREETFDELLSYTQVKNVNIKFATNR